MNSAYRISVAWQAVEDRIPEGWVIDQLLLHPKGMWQDPDGSIYQRENVWTARARPFANFAWKRSGMDHIKQGWVGRGMSPVEALLNVAVLAEHGAKTGSESQYDMAAVDRLFASLFEAV